MKQNIFKTVLVALAVALFASCTQNDDVLETIENGSSNETGYVYNLHLDGGAPVYSDDMTRASTTWKTGSEVSLRLKSGSSIIDGTAKFDGSNWKLTTDKKLSTTTRATGCGALYYENAKDLNSLTPSSIVYMGEGTYTTSSTDIYVSVTMKPITGRLRFKGKAGTRISVKGNITCPKVVSASTDKLTWETQRYNFLSIDAVELNVNSNGYTNYIYVTFDYSYNWKNTLTIVNETEGKTYERLDIDGAILAVGSSGFFTIPTSSNYTSLNWEKIDPNTTIKAVDYLPLYDGVVTAWETGSSAYSFYEGVYETTKDDNDIMKDIVKNTLYNVADHKGYIFSWSYRKPDTQYYLCAVAYNKDGERGSLSKQIFTTRSETEPQAIISNLKATTLNGNSVWQYDVTLANGAVKYYRIIWSDLNYYNEHNSFLVYWAYEKINKGYLSTFNKKTDSFSRNSDQCVVVLVAVDSKGNICGYDIVKATTSTKSNVQRTSQQSRSKMMDMRIPKIIKSRRPEIR